MSGWLIVLTGCAYAWVAIEQIAAKNWPMAIVYACYSGANVGLYLMAQKG